MTTNLNGVKRRTSSTKSNNPYRRTITTTDSTLPKQSIIRAHRKKKQTKRIKSGSCWLSAWRGAYIYIIYFNKSLGARKIKSVTSCAASYLYPTWTSAACIRFAWNESIFFRHAFSNPSVLRCSAAALWRVCGSGWCNSESVQPTVTHKPVHQWRRTRCTCAAALHVATNAAQASVKRANTLSKSRLCGTVLRACDL